MSAPQLFPKPAKRMRQPRKALLCEQLANEDRIKGARAALEGETNG